MKERGPEPGDREPDAHDPLVLVKGGFEYAPPKSRRSRRDVELRAETILALREHRKRQLEERMRLGGVPEDHGLVFATHTLVNGGDLNTVSKMLGHASVKITLDVYGHLMPGAQKRALAALDGVFG